MSKPMSRPASQPAHQTDSDARKGAIEPDKPEGRAPSNPARPDQHGNLSDQLPHRKSDSDGADTDFPEPGSSPEHSGEKIR